MRSESPNATGSTLGQQGFNNLSERTALQEFDPSQPPPKFLEHLKKVGVKDPEQFIRNVQQGKYHGETSLEQGSLNSNEGTDHRSSNGEKIEALRSLMDN